MGVVIKYYLLGDDMPALVSKFPACRDITTDLNNAFAFWDQAMKVLVFLRDVQFISPELFAEFASADRLLHGQ
jgi:hypothetical protein